MNQWKSHLSASLVAILVSLPGSVGAAIDLGPEEFVQAGGADIQVEGYSVPSFEDWNIYEEVTWEQRKLDFFATIFPFRDDVSQRQKDLYVLLPEFLCNHFLMP